MGAQVLPVTVPSDSAQSEQADAQLQVSARWGLHGTSFWLSDLLPGSLWELMGPAVIVLLEPEQLCGHSSYLRDNGRSWHALVCWEPLGTKKAAWTIIGATRSSGRADSWGSDM